MITVILLAAGAIVVIGAIYLAFASGNKGGRNSQASDATATAQQLNNNPRGDIRSSGSAND